MADNLIELSMVITKATLQPNGAMRWQAVVSDTSRDNTGEATSTSLFRDWIDRIDGDKQSPDWLPPPRMPFLGVSHYPSLDGDGEAGITEKMYIDGDKFKASGVFYDTPLGRALFEVVRTEIDLVKRGEIIEKPIRISAAWWDIGHQHGSFLFERKSLTDVCPMCAKGGNDDKVYLMGLPDHWASTRVPINPRTLLLTERAMTTRKEDAASIVPEDLAEELEEKSRLVGKSEAGLVTKAKKPPVKDEEEAEEMEEEEMEEEEEQPKGKKKPRAGSFIASRSAVTWDAAKALPEAATHSRLELMGLVRRNISEQPEGERLGMLEALLGDVETEVQEIKTAMEELYFLQPAVEETLFEPDIEEDIPMADYLDEFSEAVREARDSEQGPEQKAALMQAALNKLVPQMKADLDPKTGGDVAQALRAALAPITEQIAQINARLGVPQNQQAVIIPTQKSAVPTLVNPVQPESQLPISPITGKESSLTAHIRRSVGIY